METPERDAAAALDILRAGGSRADGVRDMLSKTSDLPASRLRSEMATILAASIHPEDHAIARWLLERETEALRVAGSGCTETLLTLVAVVARFADPHDALLIWRAREATAQTRENVDVEQMARAGVERVRRVLGDLARGDGSAAREAADALAWLDAGIAEGITSDLAGYFLWSDERFGLSVSGPT